MAYRLVYVVNIEWVGAGMGPMGGQLSVLPGFESGGAQTLEMSNTPGGQNIVGTGTGGALASADITTITNAMAADIAAKLNVPATLAQVGAWTTGGG
jgi:hypothetical protein